MRLRVDQASCFRGDRLVLDGVNLAVAAGGAVLLTGPNGAGKSTLLRVIAGLKRLDGGSVTFDGSDEYAGELAYLGHQDAVKPGLTARENLAFAAAMGGGDADAALADAGLGKLASLPVRMFSAGQKRRLAIARTGTNFPASGGARAPGNWRSPASMPRTRSAPRSGNSGGSSWRPPPPAPSGPLRRPSGSGAPRPRFRLPPR